MLPNVTRGKNFLFETEDSAESGQFGSNQAGVDNEEIDTQHDTLHDELSDKEKEQEDQVANTKELRFLLYADPK